MTTTVPPFQGEPLVYLSKALKEKFVTVYLCDGSQFQLTLSEGTSEIQHYDYPDASHYQNLQHIPTKQALVVVPLKDVGSNGVMMQDSFIDLLVAVQNV